MENALQTAVISILPSILPLIFAITLHEAAHAYAAKYFGDSTAYMQGRMSLNPVVHIDLFGTILLPALLYLVHAPFLLGYAKPVPIDYGKLRKPKRDMAWVALAGPLANLLMAFIWIVFATILKASDVSETFFQQMAIAGLRINLVIFAFNLFPLPPLDGGRIMTSLLPHKYAYKYAQIEPYGFFILLALLYFKSVFWDYWIIPVASLGNMIVAALASPLSLFL
jgi:Zn-dependent protease